MARAPQVQVVASAISDRLNAPSTNPAIQLSEALAAVAPEARAFAFQRADDLRREAGIRAKTDAVKASGAAFGDAVREGTIEPTQNPFYMDAYRRESAAVRGTSALSRVVQDSATWVEKNDPAAFQARLNREVGAIGEEIAGGDEEAQLGYLAAANPVLQQQAAANTAYNVNRIVQERETNAGALAAQTIGDINRANGGNAAPQQVLDGLAEQKAEYIATGGTESQWDNVLLAGITTAAYNAGDTDLIDITKDPLLGSIYNRPGVAADLESTQYRIRQGVLDRITFAESAKRAEDQAKGRELLATLYTDYGDELLLGNLPVQEIIDKAQAAGYSMGAISSAISSTVTQVQQTQSLQNARFSAVGLNPATGLEVINLFTEVARNPTAPGLADKIDQAYLTGRLSPADATRLQSQIGNAQQALASGGGSGGGGRGSGGNGGGGDDSPTLTSTGQVRVRSVTALNQRIEAISFGIANRTRQWGQQEQYEEWGKRAAQTYLASHPGDYQGAANAASLYMTSSVQMAPAGSAARSPSTSAAPATNSRREPGRD